MNALGFVALLFLFANLMLGVLNISNSDYLMAIFNAAGCLMMWDMLARMRRKK